MLQYITTNFESLMLVNNFFSKQITNNLAYQLICRDKLNNLIKKIKKKKSKKIDHVRYCISLINDEEYLKKFFYFSIRNKIDNVYFSYVKIRLLEMLEKEYYLKLGTEKVDFSDKDEDFDYDYSRLSELIKNNKNIEFYAKSYYVIHNLELFKYFSEHVKMFKYDKNFNKVYLTRHIFINNMGFNIGNEKRKIFDYIKENYTREEILNSNWKNEIFQN